MAVSSWRRDSLNDAFNAPALLRSDEAHRRRAFPVKQHDYEGGVLTNGGVTRADGAPSQVTSHQLVMDGGVAPATCTSCRIGQAWR
jgi:hypothetical protein